MADAAEGKTRVIITIPEEMVRRLDEQAERLGIGRASLMRIYISRGLEAGGAGKKD